MNDFDIKFLGTPRIIKKQKAVEIKDKKAMLLLFVLVIRGASSRQRLASLLWPGTDQARSQASLRLRLHKLNKEFPGLLAADMNSVALSSTVTHDIGFLISDSTIPPAVAVSAHREYLLASLEFPDLPQVNSIIRHYRQRLASLACQYLYDQARSALNTKQYSQAIFFLNQILLISPHNETACRHLMRVHVLNDCRAAALESYELFRNGMREALGVEPDSKTRKLHLSILTMQNESDNIEYNNDLDINSVIF